MFLTKSAEKFTHFKIIIGPSGCRKTQKFVIKYRIEVADTFAKGLSQEIGMKLLATGVFDLFLGYISQAYHHYHTLPNDQIAAIEMVFKVLEESPGVYARKYKQIPVLFINGVDILAKYTPKLCEVLPR